MTVLRLEDGARALLFDMDGTLYTNGEYLRSQIDLPVRRLAERRGLSFEAMSAGIAAYRERWEAAHGGRKTSLGHVFQAFGVSMEENIRWREDLYEPERYLERDERLRHILRILSGGEGRPAFALAVVTNNPLSIARRTLAALGVEDLFPVIVALDTCGVSKPHRAPYLKAAELLGVPASSCVSVGDRYDVDIAVPLELGMGGILVEGVEEVYGLTRLFP
ncbi:MAG: HAD family hydrolase [Treponema sp.]|jgi:phosphoglycolate phosphatase/putative hydrolase of the HAD superfamily|nr:HAD family hydrolase [Treponema sp.]